jgi:hypothetical protein
MQKLNHPGRNLSFSPARGDWSEQCLVSIHDTHSVDKINSGQQQKILKNCMRKICAFIGHTLMATL